MPHPDGAWGPHSLLYNGYRVFMECGVDHSPASSAKVKEIAELFFNPPVGIRGLFYGEIYLYVYVCMYVRIM